MSNCVVYETIISNRSIEIIKSEAKIVFDRSNCVDDCSQEPNSSESQRVEIPEIDAYWTVTLYRGYEDEITGNNNKTNENVKVEKRQWGLRLRVNNEDIVKTRMYKVRIQKLSSNPDIVRTIALRTIEVNSTIIAPSSPALDVQPRYEFHVIVTIIYIGKIFDTKLLKYVIPSPHNWILNPIKFGELFDSSDFSDFTYKVKDKEFKVHRSILSIASPVFEKTFKCGLDETKNSTANIEGCDPEIFQHLLAFIYKGAVPENLPEVALELYKIAHLYQIKLVQELCYGHILNVEFNTENVLRLYDFAKKFELQELHSNCWTYIKFKMLRIFTPLDRDPYSIHEIQKILDAEAESKEKLKKLRDKIAAVGATKNNEKVTEPPKLMLRLPKGFRPIRGGVMQANKKRTLPYTPLRSPRLSDSDK